MVADLNLLGSVGDPYCFSNTLSMLVHPDLEVWPTFENFKPSLLFIDGCRPASVVFFWQLSLYFNYLVSATAGGPESPRGHM